MKKIVSVDFEFNSKILTIHFYEYKNNYFRDYFLLNTVKDFEESLKNKNSVFKSHLENARQFLDILKEKGGKIVGRFDYEMV